MNARFDGPDDYMERTSSPDGKYVWLVSPAEWANSQWVLAGQLWHKETEACLFSPPEDWSFEGRKWKSSIELELVGRRFPGRMPGITLRLDVDALCGSIEVDVKDTRVPASSVPAAPGGQQSCSILHAWLVAYPK